MKEQLISLKTAKLATEKGFNLKEPCTCGGYPDCICEQTRSVTPDYVYRPTQSLLQKWLREVHNLHVNPYRYKDLVADNNDDCVYKVFISAKGFKTYEESLEEGLITVLKSIK